MMFDNPFVTVLCGAGLCIFGLLFMWYGLLRGSARRALMIGLGFFGQRDTSDADIRSADVALQQSQARRQRWRNPFIESRDSFGEALAQAQAPLHDALPPDALPDVPLQAPPQDDIQPPQDSTAP